MKFKVKKVLILGIIAILLSAAFSQVFAIQGSDITSAFKGSSGTNLQGAANVQKTIGTILDAVRIASAAVAIIMLTILAIKYMASSPNDRAEIKRGAIVYVVGAIVMMSASFLVTVIKEFSDNSIKVS